MGFVQIIEIETTRPEAVEALVGDWQTKTEGVRTAQRGPSPRTGTVRTRSSKWSKFRPTRMQWRTLNSRRRRRLRRSREICDGPLVFRNLDVRSVEEM